MQLDAEQFKAPTQPIHQRAGSNINFDAHVSRHDRQRNLTTMQQMTTGAYELANLESQQSIQVDPTRFKATEGVDSSISYPNATTQSTMPNAGLQRKNFNRRTKTISTDVKSIHTKHDKSPQDSAFDLIHKRIEDMNASIQEPIQEIVEIEDPPLPASRE